MNKTVSQIHPNLMCELKTPPRPDNSIDLHADVFYIIPT